MVNENSRNLSKDYLQHVVKEFQGTRLGCQELYAEVLGPDIRPVGSLGDALAMRRIRNETRLFLTGNRDYIQLWRQVVWYYRTYRPQNADGKFFAYLVWVDGRPGGFGIVREVDGKWWPTYALSEWARGGGRGLALMKRMIRIAVQMGGGVAWGKLREDNERIKKLDREIGWQFLVTDGTDITAIIEWRDEMRDW